MVRSKSLCLVAVYVVCWTVSHTHAWDIFDLEQDVKEEAMEKFKKVFGISGSCDNCSDRMPPQYMLDLYNTVADPNGVTRANNPYNAKIIRSFKEKHVVASSVTYFNISGLSPYESVLEAELHVHKHKHHSKHSKLSSKALIYTVKVYQVLNYDWISIPEKNKLIDVHYVNVLSPGWEVFHIKSAVQEWLSGQSPNYGLILTASTVNGQKLDFKFIRHPEKHVLLQPMLVLFNNENTNATGQREDSEEEWDQSHHNDLTSMYGEPRKSINEIDDDTSYRSRKRRSASKGSECSLTELYVDFEKIGWSSWIISPKGYNANYCKGHCSYPLGQSQRPTNHATVQSIVHQLSLAPAVPQPCCVPSRLLSLSLLYYDDNDNVILKQYDDMVADTCGCH